MLTSFVLSSDQIVFFNLNYKTISNHTCSFLESVMPNLALYSSTVALKFTYLSEYYLEKRVENMPCKLPRTLFSFSAPNKVYFQSYYLLLL